MLFWCPIIAFSLWWQKKKPTKSSFLLPFPLSLLLQQQKAHKTHWSNCQPKLLPWITLVICPGCLGWSRLRVWVSPHALLSLAFAWRHHRRVASSPAMSMGNSSFGTLPPIPCPGSHGSSALTLSFLSPPLKSCRAVKGFFSA